MPHFVVQLVWDIFSLVDAEPGHALQTLDDAGAELGVARIDAGVGAGADNPPAARWIMSRKTLHPRHSH